MYELIYTLHFRRYKLLFMYDNTHEDRI